MDPSSPTSVGGFIVPLSNKGLEGLNYPSFLSVEDAAKDSLGCSDAPIEVADYLFIYDRELRVYY